MAGVIRTAVVIIGPSGKAGHGTIREAVHLAIALLSIVVAAVLVAAVLVAAVLAITKHTSVIACYHCAASHGCAKQDKARRGQRCRCCSSHHPGGGRGHSF